MMEVEAHLESPEMVVQVQNLIKRFDHVTALDNISINVPRGTIYGFIGPSGCGKTTTIRCMIGNYRPTEGVVKVLGQTPDSFTLAEKKRIGYMPQLFILYPELSVWENLNFAASVYGYPLNRKARLEELLDLVELSGHEKKLVRDISGGMQRRLSLATTLIHDPELIFLDEPTAGIDPVLRRKFWDYFRRLRDEGRTLFVTTQYVGEAAYCDYVGVMAHGTLLMVETPDDLRYKAMGGDIVQFHASTALNSKMITDLRKLPFILGELAFLDSQSVQLIVEDASTAIPRLLDWGENEGIEIEAINQHVPPFDDVFVKIMEDENVSQKGVVISE
jgi:ABC-2 type transport system ATP-binding protein